MSISISNRKLSFNDLPQYTVQEWANWEGKWELIEGIPYAMFPIPSLKHQQINGRLYRLFEDALVDCDDCEVFLPINFKLDENTVVHPDLLVVCNRKEEDIYLTTIPKLVVEILSKSTKQKDKNVKPKLYQSVGILYYLIVDTALERVDIFKLKDKKYVLDRQVKTSDYTFEWEEEYSFNIDFEACW